MTDEEIEELKKLYLETEAAELVRLRAAKEAARIAEEEREQQVTEYLNQLPSPAQVQAEATEQVRESIITIVDEIR